MGTGSGEREYRKLLRKNHFCLDCRKQDAYTFGGRAYCYECGEKRRQKTMAYRQANREQLNRRRMERYGLRKGQFLCVTCGRELGFLDNGVNCYRCASREKAHYMAQRKLRRIVGVACYQCCEEPPMEGKKLCAGCYEKNMDKLRKAWAAGKGAQSG